MAIAANPTLTLVDTDPPAAGGVQADLTRLARRCRQHENALARMAEALQVLRAGTRALHEENRELRRELERLRAAAAQA